MFCSYCKAARMANEAPCSNCGAPSPLLNAQPQPNEWGARASEPLPWGGPAIPQTFGGQWNQQAPQMPAQTWSQSAGQFDQNPTNAWQHPSGQLDQNPTNAWQHPSGQLDQNPTNAWQHPSGQLNSMSPSWRNPSGQLDPMPSWQQPSGLLDAPGSTPDATPQAEWQSMLPVPYQGGMELQPAGQQSTISLQLIPQQSIQHLLPAQPLNPDIVHVPPTFTKPRPIVPKYRVISGFLSVLIVALVLCSGAGYYVKASGTWDKIVTLYSGKSVQDIQSSSETIPDPPAITARDHGPAQNIIPSVSTTTRIDTTNNQPIIQQDIFQPNQIFWLTFSVQPLKGTNGHVTAKWYTNGKFYMDTEYSKDIQYNAANVENFSMQMRFPNPASGTVEIYWNNTFAQRYYFAVRD
jgi:hypothetical protein